ncbi:KATNB1-like protein 1 isoform X4 [Varanus komodoensis]|uniref:KATNB1-like protein 1 isoform X4 n=1 Tax=Varanus komodoensis TaxID=61221 RepID=UPI001CF7DA18|nr:KATNB1-like protein 1 isoform X4 [Varanus komodoensis]
MLSKGRPVLCGNNIQYIKVFESRFQTMFQKRKSYCRKVQHCVCTLYMLYGKMVTELSCYCRTTVGQTVACPHPVFKVVSCRRKVHYYSPKPCFRKKQFPKVKGRDMANKENELACAGNLPAKLPADGRTFLLNSSDSSCSQTESPSSKFSGFFSEVSEDHDTMAQVLFSRNLRLNVALTFWRRRSISELVAYLVRIQDLGVAVDCLPVLTSSLQEEKTYISVGCCVDLLPLVKSMLKSKFEEYVIVGLNWLQAVIKRWWSELSAHTEKIEDGMLMLTYYSCNDLPGGQRVCTHAIMH